MKAAWRIALLVLLTGCGDPLKEASLIEDPRVLGARIEVAGEPERASPAPGEVVTVRWLVAAPEPEPELGFSLLACLAAPPGASLPGCAEAPFASATSDPQAAEPRFEFQVPVATAGADLLVYGVLCPAAFGTLDGGAPVCQGGHGTRVSLDFSLAGTAENQNPAILPGALTFDGDTWPSGSVCTEVPQIEPGSRHRLGLSLSEQDREPLERLIDADPDRETLQVSHFSTAGRLERAFSVLGPDTGELDVSVGWSAPDDFPEMAPVRFFVVVRDLRGGTDWVERAACVSP